jgi:dTMP kinase
MIKRMTVYLDSTVDAAARRVVECAAAPFTPNIVERPPAHPSWTSYWESIKGDFHDTIKGSNPTERFSCFITGNQLSHGDVAYALHAMQIPTLSLDASVSVQSFMKDPPKMYSDVALLCHNNGEEGGDVEAAIKRFFCFPENPGRVFVIEGGDGAGKETQTKLLIERLRSDGKKVETLDFPNDACASGWAIREVLSGKCGRLDDIAPGAFGALYAFNRFEKRPLLIYWIQRGVNVILDRYMTANFGYHCLKVADDEGRMRDIRHMETFECNYLFLPKTHRVAYLRLDPTVAWKALLADGTRKELDIFEKASIDRKRHIMDCFEWCCDHFAEWDCVACVDGDGENGTRISKEEVHNTIYNLWKNDFV